MSIQRGTFYWLVCDEPDCGYKSMHEEDRVYLTPEEAVQQGEYADWLVVDGEHYCSEHAFKHEQKEVSKP